MTRDDILDGILELANGFFLPLEPYIVFWHTHPHGRVGPSSDDLGFRADVSNYECLVVTIPSGEAVMY